MDLPRVHILPLPAGEGWGEGPGPDARTFYEVVKRWVG